MNRLFGCDVFAWNERTTERVVLCLGFFDCLHKGHVKVIGRARDAAKSMGAKVAAFTFDGDPHAALGRCRKPVFTFEERVYRMSYFGVDEIFCAAPNGEFFAIDARDFVQKLFDVHNIAAVVAGSDYTFGAGAEGSADMLAKICRERGIACEICDMLEYAPGKKIASREIERAVAVGNIAKINEWLPKPYFVLGEVVHGRGDGKKFGFPTANIPFPQDKLRLAAGVYATDVTIDGRAYHAVTNVGTHPTFGDDSYNVESLVIGWDGDLYGKTIEVAFEARLRDIIHFDDPSALKAQIDRDAAQALDLLGGGDK